MECIYFIGGVKETSRWKEEEMFHRRQLIQMAKSIFFNAFFMLIWSGVSPTVLVITDHLYYCLLVGPLKDPRPVMRDAPPPPRSYHIRYTFKLATDKQHCSKQRACRTMLCRNYANFFSGLGSEYFKKFTQI